MTTGIVILNYNSSAYTIKCVESVMRHEAKGSYHIVVVDNLSPDVDQIKLLEAELPTKVHLIKNERNTGYAAGNNTGAKFLIEKYNVDYVMIVNNDCMFTTPLLSQLIEGLNSDANMSAISPYVAHDYNEHFLSTIQVRRILPLYKSMVCQSTILSHFGIGKKWENDFVYKDLWPYERKVYKVDSINGAAFLIRSDVLLQIGYLDDRTFLYSEELILGIQLKNRDLYCGLDCRVSILHHQGASTNMRGKSIPFAMFKHELDSLTVLYKNYYSAGFLSMFLFKTLRYFEFAVKKIYLSWK